MSIIAPCFEPQSPLREKTVLSLRQFHGCGALFVVVCYVVDFHCAGRLVICSTTAYHLPSRFVHLLLSIGGRDAARCGAGQCSARIFLSEQHHRLDNGQQGPLCWRVLSSWQEDNAQPFTGMVNFEQFSAITGGLSQNATSLLLLCWQVETSPLGVGGNPRSFVILGPFLPVNGWHLAKSEEYNPPH